MNFSMIKARIEEAREPGDRRRTSRHPVEIGAKVRELGFTKELLIAVSGYGQQDDRERSRKAGFDHHLVKPVDMLELLSLLKKVRA